MSKKKLTLNQQRRIQSRHHRNLRQDKQYDPIAWQEDLLGSPQQGLVVARYAMHADVESVMGQVFRCNLRRTLTSLVVGDKVIWREGNEQLQGITGVIETVMPRQNVLSRPDYYDGLKPIAANIDSIFIVSSVLPKLSLNIIDRYLVACELAQIPAILIVNKVDLLSEVEFQALEKRLSTYVNLGYRNIMLSAKTGENIALLQQELQQGTHIFVGQSGVGKSSLINHILPNVQTQTGDINQETGLGIHTTTASQLYHLPQGGNLIDSPGIREFGLWHLEPQQITQGYREFAPYLGGCKFSDCKHLQDPGCVIREAVEKGAISAHRFENYHRLIASLTENRSARHFNKNTHK